MVFRQVDNQISFPSMEEKLLEWWRNNNVVRQYLEKGDRRNPFVFFEGPPTANGKPGVHHVESRSAKDIINRFQRMRGRYVIGARGGWDTHGLPVEIEVEKELGFRGKPDIEKYGVEAFNKACRESVYRYVRDWEHLTGRMAYWLDLEKPYATFDNSYIESLWWILKSLWDKDLLFRDYKVTMHCPRCGTSLSDHEVSQGFEDNVDDPSVWVKFKITSTNSDLLGVSVLAWTTTPWTLPANVALAVNPDAEYVVVEANGERFLLAKSRYEPVFGEPLDVKRSFYGRDIVGIQYENLYPGVAGPGTTVDSSSVYKVIADEFVSLENGTGVVHIAPAYGDLDVGRKYMLPTLFSVDLSGNVLSSYDSFGFGGLFFKKADPLIIDDLQKRNLIFRSERVKHSYPFCWRCKTPLLYYAKQSWYIRTTAKKDELVSLNQEIHWVPDHIRNGRFGNWLENNIDWAISRERYWGTPLPIWVCNKCGAIEVIGSVAELSSKVGEDLSSLDLHRPYIDAPQWQCSSCQNGDMRRVPDVADTWFDSGSMPIAQWHYPFENQDIYELASQADYISEAIDQTRGWFYTLHAVSTLMFNRVAFKNVICLGHILDVRGEKMAKSRGNVVDPLDLLKTYGADATRWYMYASAPPYNPRKFAPEHVGEMLRQFMLTLWNTYSFFTTYANIDGWTPNQKSFDNLQLVDRWILSRLYGLVADVTNDLESYDIYQPAKRVEEFVELLSNWYVRRNRRRFWKSDNDKDKGSAYTTLYTCLTNLSRLLAPFTPFLAEEMYQNLVAEQDTAIPISVHLSSWPEANEHLVDNKLVADMEVLLSAVSAGRIARKQSGLKVRQPLQVLWVRASTVAHTEALKRFESDIRDELNVKEICYLEGRQSLASYKLKPNLKLLGKKYGKIVPEIKSFLDSLDNVQTGQLVQVIEDGNRVTVETTQGLVELLPEEILVETSSPEGYSVAEDRGIMVALDTHLTHELIIEGAARDLVRLIQDARKTLNLPITSQIVINISNKLDETAARLAEEVFSTHGTHIQSETLASEVLVDDVNSSTHRIVLALEGQDIEIGVTPV